MGKKRIDLFSFLFIFHIFIRFSCYEFFFACIGYPEQNSFLRQINEPNEHGRKNQVTINKQTYTIQRS